MFKFKKGFTLQELLISMAIIGIVAAIAAPGIVGMIPDRKKSMYMKAYNVLANQVNEMLEDSSLYWTTYNADGSINTAGFRTTQRPVDEDEFGAEVTGNTKFARILASRLNTVDDIACVAATAQCKFTTPDGIDWYYNTIDNSQNFQLVIDINGDEEPNEFFSDDQDNPDRFGFLISSDGDITIQDALGQVYLKDPTNMHETRQNINEANDVYSDMSDTDRTFMTQMQTTIKNINNKV